jgi:hypothetical protein
MASTVDFPDMIDHHLNTNETNAQYVRAPSRCTGSTYPSSLAGTDGVSMNRNPDGAAGAPFVLHSTLSSLSSAGGKRANGTAW